MGKAVSRFSSAAASGAQRSGVDRALVVAPPAHPVDAVRALVEQLPNIDDVREVDDADTSPLTVTEEAQRTAAESTITTAQAAGKAAVWVIGRALQVIARGRLHRDSGLTLEEYVDAALGISAPHARRWRAGAPIAAAIEAAPVGERTGPPPESHVRELPGDPELATALYEAVVDVAEAAGVKVTARLITQARRGMPRVVPADPVTRSALLRTAVRVALGDVTRTADPIGAPAAGIQDDGDQDQDREQEQPPPPAPAFPLLDSIAEDVLAVYGRLGSDDVEAEVAADRGAASAKLRELLDRLGRAAHRARKLDGREDGVDDAEE